MCVYIEREGDMKQNINCKWILGNEYKDIGCASLAISLDLKFTKL